MKNIPNDFSIWQKLHTQISVYYTYVKRLNAIVTAYKVPPKKRVQDMQFLLTYFAEALEEVEKMQLEMQFPKPTGQISCHTEWQQAMGIDFVVHLN